MGTTNQKIDAAKNLVLTTGIEPVTSSLPRSVLYRLSYVSVECCKPLIVRWSGRRESNPHNQLGRLRFYH